MNQNIPILLENGLLEIATQSNPGYTGIYSVAPSDLKFGPAFLLSLPGVGIIKQVATPESNMYYIHFSQLSPLFHI